MVNLALSLIGSNGDTISLADDGDYVLTVGVTGFGIPATQVRIDPSAADGGTWRHTKRGVRTLDLPIVILGTDRADTETKLRRLARLLQDSSGPTILQANYSDSTSLFLEAHYVGGAETVFGSDANGYFCRWVVQMQAPNPYWRSSVVSSFTVSNGSTGRGLLPELSKLKVSSSQSLGIISVNNAGDVPMFPKFIIEGPINSLEILANGIGYTYTEPIALGDLIIIDHELGTVVDASGTNMYSALGPAPKLFSLPAGYTTVAINGVDTDITTKITCYYSPKYEVIH